MKYLKAALCVFLIAVLFCGCNFRVSSTVDDLISPISPFGDNADVKIALDEYAKAGYSLKTPNAGEYITSYSFYDIDGDETQEAIAFYEPSDALGTVDMAVIQRSDDKEWSVVENIVGKGRDVYSLAFEDVNGDGSDEILVCWDAISNSTSHIFTVYRYSKSEKESKLLPVGESININNYILVDMCGGSTKEVLAFKLDSGNRTTAGAQLYSFTSNRMHSLGETKLDAHITSYEDLKIEKAENDVRVYADAVKTDGASMLTEVIYWSNGYHTIVSPFYSYSTGLTQDTNRKAMISSRDMNGDGLIEIPKDKKLKKLPKGIFCIDWKIYKKTTLIHTDYSLFSPNDGYHVVIPDKYIDKITVSYDRDNKCMTVKSKESGKEVFSVMTVLKATYNENADIDYTKVMENAGYCYLAKINGASDIKISMKELKGYIQSV